MDKDPLHYITGDNTFKVRDLIFVDPLMSVNVAEADKPTMGARAQVDPMGLLRPGL